MADNSNCDKLTRLSDESWKNLVSELKTELEAACGRPNVITETILDDWKNQIRGGIRDGQAITRQIAMQTVVMDYVINERINGTMRDEDFKQICLDLRMPNGLDALYAKIIHFLAGSSVAIKSFSIAEESTH